MGETNVPADPKIRVFISYSRVDRAFAEALRARLEAGGVDAFLDLTDIAPGEDWRARLGALIETADCMVFVLSPESAASQICAWEIEHAASLSKRILPVVRRDVDPDQAPAALSRLNFLFMRDAAEEAAALAQLEQALAVDISWVRTHTRIGERAMEWSRAGRPGRLLLRGADIASAEEWRDRRPTSAPDLSDPQRAYITASRRGAGRRLRRWLAGAAAAAVAAAALAGAALHQRAEAVRNAEAALAERNRALLTESRFLAAEADALRERGDAAGALEAALWGLPRELGASGSRPLSSEARRAAYEALMELRERPALFGHTKEITSIAYRPDGAEIATASRDGTVWTWGLDGERRARLDHDGDQVRHVFYDGAGERIVTLTGGGTIAFWSGDGTLASFARFKPAAGRQPAAASQKQRWIAAGGEQLRIWSFDGAPLAAIDAHDGGVTALAAAHDGQALVTGGGDGKIRFWARGGDGAWTAGEMLQAHDGSVLRLALSPRGDRLASVGGGDDLRIWARGENGVWTRRASHLTHRAVGALFSGPDTLDWRDDGEMLITGGYDDLARLWSADGAPLAVMRGHSGDVIAARFIEGGAYAMTASSDGTAKFWSLAGEELMSFASRGEPITAIAASPTEPAVALGGTDATTRHYTLFSRTYARLVAGGRLERVAFTPDSRALITAGGSAEPKLWTRGDEAASGVELSETPRWRQGPELAAHPAGAFYYSFTMAVAPDGRSAITGSSTGTALAHSIHDSSHRELRARGSLIAAAAYAADGDLALVLTTSQGLQLWRTADELDAWRVAAEIPLEGRTNVAASFTSDPGVIATVGKRQNDDETSTVEIWRLTERGDALELRASFEVDGFAVNAVAAHPTRPLIALAGSDGSVRLINLDGALQAATAAAPGAWGLTGVRFNPAGDVIGAFSGVPVARLWRLRQTADRFDLAPLAELVGHAEGGLAQGRFLSGVLDLRFSPDGETVGTAGADGTLRLWSLSGASLGVLRAPGETQRLAFSPDGSAVAGAWSDGAARVFPTPPPPSALLRAARDAVAAARPLGNAQRCALFLQTDACKARYPNAFVAYGAQDHSAALTHLRASKAAVQRTTPNAAAVLAEINGSLAYHALFEKDFTAAEAAARDGLRLAPQAHWIRTNLAHALLLQGRSDEASAAYEPPDGLQAGWAAAIADDIAALRKAGVDHPEFDSVIERMSATAAAAQGDASQR